ncbi:MAG: hypothetical protein IPM02_25880 [Betaproteobacteria bacterium]|nr:hypothetical protein [Betaproteobacteria bacterium]
MNSDALRRLARLIEGDILAPEERAKWASDLRAHADEVEATVEAFSRTVKWSIWRARA